MNSVASNLDSFNNLCLTLNNFSVSYYVRGFQHPPLFLRYYSPMLCGKKLKNLHFSASGIYLGIYRSYYVRGLQYMPPRVLALWGQNPAGAINNISWRLEYCIILCSFNISAAYNQNKLHRLLQNTWNYTKISLKF
jgi:hypothetical protein